MVHRRIQSLLGKPGLCSCSRMCAVIHDWSLQLLGIIVGFIRAKLRLELSLFSNYRKETVKRCPDWFTSDGYWSIYGSVSSNPALVRALVSVKCHHIKSLNYLIVSINLISVKLECCTPLMLLSHFPPRTAAMVRSSKISSSPFFNKY